MKRRLQSKSKARGIGLIEIIIGIALMGMAMSAVLLMQTQQRAVERGREMGQEQAGMQALFAQYFLSNRAAIMGAIGAPVATPLTDAVLRSHCVTHVSGLDVAGVPNGEVRWSGMDMNLPPTSDPRATCAFDATLLQARGLLPQGFRITHESEWGRWRWVAVVSRARLPGPTAAHTDDVLSNDATMLVLQMVDTGTAAPVVDANLWATRGGEINAALDALGQQGGVNSPMGGRNGACPPTVSVYQQHQHVCGSGWSVRLDSFVGN